MFQNSCSATPNLHPKPRSAPSTSRRAQHATRNRALRKDIGNTGDPMTATAFDLTTARAGGK